MPLGTRTTSGIGNCPPDMKGIFAAALTIESSASNTKLIVMISTTGRMPVSAAPTPNPVKLFSDIGVSRTRHSPYFAYSPSVTR